MGESLDICPDALGPSAPNPSTNASCSVAPTPTLNASDAPSPTLATASCPLAPHSTHTHIIQQALVTTPASGSCTLAPTHTHHVVL